MTWKLIDEATGEEVTLPTTRLSFRGEEALITSFISPRHPGSTGRVFAKFEDRFGYDYFPSVFNLKLVEIP